MFEWTVRWLRADWNETAASPLVFQRAVAASRPYPHPHVKQVTTRTGILGGVPVRHFIPASPGPVTLVYFHGGSYIYGSTHTSHADFCAHLALAASLEVIGVEYRLAPEHPWPAQLEDAVAACSAIAERPLILAGDSAGGHLAVKAAHAVPAIALVLLSPWVDLEMPGRSYFENDAFEYGTRDVLLRHARGVAGKLPLASLSLARDPLRALPPCFVALGDAELPRDDILAFVEKARDAGVECRLHVAADMPHNPALFEAYHPAARAAFDAAVAFVGERVAGYQGVPPRLPGSMVMAAR